MADGVRNAFSPRCPVVVKCGPSRTKQAFKDECDINRLMRRYEKTGVLPQGVGVARYGDFSGVEDFLSAQLTLKNAEAQFGSLPARVRDRFKNSPEAFLEFVADPKNKDEAQKLGLLKEADSPPVVSAPVVPAPATPAVDGASGGMPQK